MSVVIITILEELSISSPSNGSLSGYTDLALTSGAQEKSRYFLLFSF
jgi:hypothetical protein